MQTLRDCQIIHVPEYMNNYASFLDALTMRFSDLLRSELFPRNFEIPRVIALAVQCQF